MLITVLQSSHGHTMKQFMDIFSLPEMTLLSCVNDFFMRHNIDYEPVHLYKDVKVHYLIILPSLISVSGKVRKQYLKYSAKVNFHIYCISHGPLCEKILNHSTRT